MRSKTASVGADPREVATFDIQTEALREQSIQAAKADWVSESIFENPEQVAVLGRVVILAVSPEASFGPTPSKEPLGQFRGIHPALFVESLLRQRIQPTIQILGAAPTSVEVG